MIYYVFKTPTPCHTMRAADRCMTARKFSTACLSGLLLATGLPAFGHAVDDITASDVGESSASQSYSNDRIEEFTLKGFRLGMSLTEAQPRFGVRQTDAPATGEQLSVWTKSCGDEVLIIGRRLTGVGAEQERYSLLFDNADFLQSINVTLAFPMAMDIGSVVSSIAGLYGPPTASAAPQDGAVSMLWASGEPDGFGGSAASLPDKGHYFLLWVAKTRLQFHPAVQAYQESDGYLLSMTLNSGDLAENQAC